MQFLTNTDGSGKYGFILVTPANVLNIWGGVLSPKQIFAVYDYQVCASPSRPPCSS